MKTKLSNIHAADIREGDIVTVMGTVFSVDSIDRVPATNIINFTLTNETSIIHLSTHLLDLFAEVSREIVLPTENHSVIENVELVDGSRHEFAILHGKYWRVYRDSDIYSEPVLHAIGTSEIVFATVK